VRGLSCQHDARLPVQFALAYGAAATAEVSDPAGLAPPHHVRDWVRTALAVQGYSSPLAYVLPANGAYGWAKAVGIAPLQPSAIPRFVTARRWRTCVLSAAYFGKAWLRACGDGGRDKGGDERHREKGSKYCLYHWDVLPVKAMWQGGSALRRGWAVT